MARLLFAAHDPGGALMIGAAAAELTARGHDIEFIAAGPAVGLWQAAGHAVTALAADDDPAGALDAGADGLVAGTGFGPFERRCWQWARGAGVRSLGAIDSWTHFLRRFETPEGYDFPDVVGVIDDTVARELAADAGHDVACAAVGQPHLEAQTARLAAARAGHRFDAARPVLVFFSEPIRGDFGAAQRGYDQFQAFEAVVRGLAGALPPGARFLVKPHPRETLPDWQVAVDAARAATGLGAEIVDASAEALLAASDGALGMTSMVLLEAHLAGMPTLSLQPGRIGIANPAVEFAADVITDTDMLAPAVAALMHGLGRRLEPHVRFHGALDGARRRFADVVETRVLC